ncbi:ankyrin repeat domain-containing protein, partial [Aspergillus ruber CBS 135680]
IVKLLLERGANPNTEGGRYGYAIIAACESGGGDDDMLKDKALDCVNTLLEYCVDVNQKGGALHTPLQMAAYQGDVELVERFCNHGADIHTVGGKYHTALQAAVAGDSIETARLLLNAGADPNENGGEYGSALHAA